MDLRIFTICVIQICSQFYEVMNAVPNWAEFRDSEPYTNLTLDQILTQAAGGIGLLANSMVSSDGTVVAELDMRLTREQFNFLYPPRPESFTHALRKKRKAVRNPTLRWTNGIFPYQFERYAYTDKDKYWIRQAMTEWEKYTCLQFRPRSGDRNYAQFVQGPGGCSSQLGMVGNGRQDINLDRNGCRFKGLYLHEIGHAIGLVHEHQLPDRDQYIEIIYQNVEPNMRIWFNKYSTNEVNQMGVPFEYSSVMHYGITAFSQDGVSQTIRSRQPNKEHTIGRVYKKELSFSDVKVVNLMYKCAERCTVRKLDCGVGYLDENCRCVCPDGTNSCQQGASRPSCTNAHEDSWQCRVWANQGECERNPTFMNKWCDCFCPTASTGGECADQYRPEKCQAWAANGDCDQNKAWMKNNCRKTCQLCDGEKEDPDAVSCPNKYGDDDKCNEWANDGECYVNPVWMKDNCAKSCKACNQTPRPTEAPMPTTTPASGICEDKHNSEECRGWAARKECEKNPAWMIPNCKKSCGKCGGTTNDCMNEYDDRNCNAWAKYGYCDSNKGFMHVKCKAACKVCDASTKPTVVTRSTPRTTQQTGGECVNNHNNDHQCQLWAKAGHCQLSTWMVKHCARACDTCSSGPKTTTQGSVLTTCYDKSTLCSVWKDGGKCTDYSSKDIMSKVCAKSCDSCAQKAPVKDSSSRFQTTMLSVLIPAFVLLIKFMG